MWLDFLASEFYAVSFCWPMEKYHCRFLLPASLIVINDIAAYIFGFFFGRTPLIKLSPKKTWEGFIGASVATITSAFVVSMVFPYLYWRYDISFFYIYLSHSILEEVFFSARYHQVIKLAVRILIVAPSLVTVNCNISATFSDNLMCHWFAFSQFNFCPSL